MHPSGLDEPTTVGQARGRYGAACRRHGHDSEQAQNAKRVLAAANIEQYVEKVLAQAPPLTDEQRTRLAELLRPVRTAPQSGGAS